MFPEELIWKPSRGRETVDAARGQCSLDNALDAAPTQRLRCRSDVNQLATAAVQLRTSFTLSALTRHTRAGFQHDVHFSPDKYRLASELGYSCWTIPSTLRCWEARRDHYDRNENDEFAGSRCELSVAKLSSPSRRLSARNKRRPTARRSMIDDGQAKNGNLENRRAGARAQRISATD
jgi:hypothetical protein